jgi:stringent starvation protein B
MERVIAVYARENGQGMAFDVPRAMSAPASPPAEPVLQVAPPVPEPPEPPKPSAERPKLTRVK